MTLLEQSFDIAICIPTRNESLTISNVINSVDEGLTKYYPQKKSIIINIDSNSDDDTTNQFLQTASETPKISITESRLNSIGKGINIHKFLEIGKIMNIKCGAVIDGDLESTVPEWIPALVEPILSGKVDFVAPLYSRHKYDATITNQLCFPLLNSVWGVFLRQPIGGEFSFSQRYITSAWKELGELHKSSNHITSYIDAFGIDIFLTTHAIRHKFRLHQSYLGQKIHRFREIQTLKKMFLDVAAVLLWQLSQKKMGEKRNTSCLESFERPPALETNLNIDRNEIKEHLIAEFQILDKPSQNAYWILSKIANSNLGSTDKGILFTVMTRDWINILAYLMQNPPTQDALIPSLNALYILFLGRINEYFYDVSSLNHHEADLLVVEQAKRLNNLPHAHLLQR